MANDNDEREVSLFLKTKFYLPWSSISVISMEIYFIFMAL